MKLLLKLTILCFIFFGINLATAQRRHPIAYDSVKNIENFGRFRTVEIKGHAGMHLYTGETLTDFVQSGFGAIEARFGWQSTNPDSWVSQYGYPIYGFGVYSGFLGDPEIFGNPNALYGFITFKTSKPYRRNTFEITPALGLTYNLNPYDEENNPLNDAIGSPVDVYFNLNFGFSYQLTRELDLGYGISFTHFSNGRTFVPNHGLNMLGLNVALRYHYNADQRLIDKDPYSPNLIQARFKRSPRNKNTVLNKHSITTYVAIATVQNYPETEGADKERYYPFSAVLDYKYQWSNMHAVTAGIDYFRDGSLHESYPDDPGKYNLVGAHLGYDFLFWKLAIRLQAGTYLTDDRGKKNYYLRPALQYHINDWMHAQVGLKTRSGFRADWIEWGVGFSPFKW
ncbi:acyloxyacyl hydrolase [Joostella sp. CR20]|uniref:acyloxyacyl hydrolase n=1 Tax=Joostella sp. CR20 TaxID=2804312 RepID=UPI00313BD911